MPSKLQVCSQVVEQVKDLPIVVKTGRFRVVNSTLASQDGSVVSYYGLRGSSQTALNVSFRPEFFDTAFAANGCSPPKLT